MDVGVRPCRITIVNPKPNPYAIHKTRDLANLKNPPPDSSFSRLPGQTTLNT